MLLLLVNLKMMMFKEYREKIFFFYRLDRMIVIFDDQKDESMFMNGLYIHYEKRFFKNEETLFKSLGSEAIRL